MVQEEYDEFSLNASEIFWRDRYFWLQECGYILRPRYHPDWTASWKDTGRLMIEAEDGVSCPYAQLIDAKRIRDGATVILKKVDPSNDPEELAITRLFSSESYTADSQNHCIPLYDILKTLEGDRETDIMVFPYLFPCNTPPFETFGEAVEFFCQAFEGLKFIHDRRVAHRDAKWDNIMMDARHLYRDEFHPMSLPYKRDLSAHCRTRSRTKHPVKYYFIDFGLSQRFPPNVVPRCPPGFGGDRTVPEFKRDEPCDPFAVDVYCIANAIREEFTQGVPLLTKPKKGFGFIEGLLADMTQEDPSKRPNMEEAALRLQEITSRLSSWKLRSRIANVDENSVAGLLRSTYHWIKQAIYIVQGVPAVPKPL